MAKFEVAESVDVAASFESELSSYTTVSPNDLKQIAANYERWLEVRSADKKSPEFFTAAIDRQRDSFAFGKDYNKSLEGENEAIKSKSEKEYKDILEGVETVIKSLEQNEQQENPSEILETFFSSEEFATLDAQVADELKLENGQKPSLDQIITYLEKQDDLTKSQKEFLRLAKTNPTEAQAVFRQRRMEQLLDSPEKQAYTESQDALRKHQWLQGRNDLFKLLAAQEKALQADNNPEALQAFYTQQTTNLKTLDADYLRFAGTLKQSQSWSEDFRKALQPRFAPFNKRFEAGVKTGNFAEVTAVTDEYTDFINQVDKVGQKTNDTEKTLQSPQTLNRTVEVVLTGELSENDLADPAIIGELLCRRLGLDASDPVVQLYLQSPAMKSAFTNYQASVQTSLDRQTQAIETQFDRLKTTDFNVNLAGVQSEAEFVRLMEQDTGPFLVQGLTDKGLQNSRFQKLRQAALKKLYTKFQIERKLDNKQTREGLESEMAKVLQVTSEERDQLMRTGDKTAVHALLRGKIRHLEGRLGDRVIGDKMWDKAVSHQLEPAIDRVWNDIESDRAQGEAEITSVMKSVSLNQVDLSEARSAADAWSQVTQLGPIAQLQNGPARVSDAQWDQLRDQVMGARLDKQLSGINQARELMQTMDLTKASQTQDFDSYQAFAQHHTDKLSKVSKSFDSNTTWDQLRQKYFNGRLFEQWQQIETTQKTVADQMQAAARFTPEDINQSFKTKAEYQAYKRAQIKLDKGLIADPTWDRLRAESMDPELDRSWSQYEAKRGLKLNTQKKLLESQISKLSLPPNIATQKWSNFGAFQTALYDTFQFGTSVRAEDWNALMKGPQSPFGKKSLELWQSLEQNGESAQKAMAFVDTLKPEHALHFIDRWQGNPDKLRQMSQHLVESKFGLNAQSLKNPWLQQKINQYVQTSTRALQQNITRDERLIAGQTLPNLKLKNGRDITDPKLADYQTFVQSLGDWPIDNALWFATQEAATTRFKALHQEWLQIHDPQNPQLQKNVSDLDEKGQVLSISPLAKRFGVSLENATELGVSAKSLRYLNQLQQDSRFNSLGSLDATLSAKYGPHLLRMLGQMDDQKFLDFRNLASQADYAKDKDKLSALLIAGVAAMGEKNLDQTLYIDLKNEVARDTGMTLTSEKLSERQIQLNLDQVVGGESIGTEITDGEREGIDDVLQIDEGTADLLVDEITAPPADQNPPQTGQSDDAVQLADEEIKLTSEYSDLDFAQTRDPSEAVDSDPLAIDEDDTLPLQEQASSVVIDESPDIVGAVEPDIQPSIEQPQDDLDDSLDAPELDATDEVIEKPVALDLGENLEAKSSPEDQVTAGELESGDPVLERDFDTATNDMDPSEVEEVTLTEQLVDAEETLEPESQKELGADMDQTKPGYQETAVLREETVEFDLDQVEAEKEKIEEKEVQAKTEEKLRIPRETMIEEIETTAEAGAKEVEAEQKAQLQAELQSKSASERLEAESIGGEVREVTGEAARGGGDFSLLSDAEMAAVIEGRDEKNFRQQTMQQVIDRFINLIMRRSTDFIPVEIEIEPADLERRVTDPDGLLDELWTAYDETQNVQEIIFKWGNSLQMELGDKKLMFEL